MPMVSEAVGYRYSCRRSDCRLIPLRETQWITGASGDGGDRQTWFCPACGREYKQGIHSVPVDSIGQDLALSYVIFMQLEVQGGTQTMCAMAEAPSELLQSLLTTLKLVLATVKHKIKPGAQGGIIDLMTVSSDMFMGAMKHFPKTNKAVKARCPLPCRTGPPHQDHV